MNARETTDQRRERRPDRLRRRAEDFGISALLLVTTAAGVLTGLAITLLGLTEDGWAMGAAVAAVVLSVSMAVGSILTLLDESDAPVRQTAAPQAAEPRLHRVPPREAAPPAAEATDARRAA